MSLQINRGAKKKEKLTPKIWDDFIKYELEKQVHKKIIKREEVSENHYKRIFNGANNLGTMHLKNYIDKYHLFFKNVNTKSQ